MPLASSAGIRQPKPDVVLWRYLSFSKFASLLAEGVLHFARADTLEDLYEGAELILPGDKSVEEVVGTEVKDRVTFAGSIVRSDLPDAKEVFMCCWCAGERESAAMWKVFAGPEGGLAITTTAGRLRDALRDLPGHDVWLGEVAYVDYGEHPNPIDEMPHRYFHKLKSFESEREVRALVWEHGRPIDETVTGLHVKIDVGTLLTDVIFAPNTPPWIEAVVRRVTESLGHELSFRGSGLRLR